MAFTFSLMRNIFATKKLWITVGVLTLSLFSGSFSVAYAFDIARQLDFSGQVNMSNSPDGMPPSGTNGVWEATAISSGVPTHIRLTLYNTGTDYGNNMPDPMHVSVDMRGSSDSYSSTVCSDTTLSGDTDNIVPYSSSGQFYTIDILCDGSSRSVLSGETLKFTITGGFYYGYSPGNFYVAKANGTDYSPPIDGSVIQPYFVLYNGTADEDAPPDTHTRFLSVEPVASSTVATSSPVTVGGHVYVNSSDYVEGKTYLQMTFTNYTASLVTGSALQAWDTAFGDIILPITASSTDLDISTTTDKFGIYSGKTEGSYRIVIKTCPWYGFGLFCDIKPLNATSTYFYIGGKTQFDIDQEAGNLGIFGLAPGSDPFNATSTNASLDCNFAINFDVYKCLWSFVIPNPYLTNQVMDQYKRLPIVGWPIRFVEVLITTTATTSLPVISYTFSEDNTFLGGVNIHFDPWPYFYTSGSLVKDEFLADDGSGNVWDIMGPLIKIIVYMTLLFVIIRRLTGLNWGKPDWNESESINVSTTTDDKGRSSARTTHTFSKRRKL